MVQQLEFVLLEVVRSTLEILSDNTYISLQSLYYYGSVPCLSDPDVL
jgi:hypothetical protein